MAEEKAIRSLRRMRRMPLPGYPYVENYGAFDCGDAHHVWIHPAMTRRKQIVSSETLIEEGQSACFFHPKNPATSICSMSGRMICELCTTEWEGEQVSFEALQTMIKNGSQKVQQAGQVKWDDVALALSIFPLIIWPVTIVTAPLALGICCWFWRQGVTSPVRKSRWRYVVAGLLSALQVGFWLWFLFSEIGGSSGG